jgi:hypothetical protein
MKMFKGFVNALCISVPIWILIFVLSGCNHYMTNDEIIRESKKCTDAGLVAVPIRAGWESRTIHIECTPDEGGCG